MLRCGVVLNERRDVVKDGLVWSKNKLQLILVGGGHNNVLVPHGCLRFDGQSQGGI